MATREQLVATGLYTPALVIIQSGRRRSERTVPSRLLAGAFLTCVALGASACSGGSDDGGRDPGQQSPTASDSTAANPVANKKTSEPLPPKDSQAIYDAWKAYKTAILTKNGKAAADLVAEDTFDFYEGIREKSLDTKAAELEGLSASEQLSVLVMRIQIPAATLRSINGRELFVLGTKMGMTDAEGSNRISVTDATIVGTYGRAIYVLDGEKTKLKMHFRYEDGRWKVKLMDLMKIANMALMAMATEAGMTVAELAEQTLIEQYGQAKAKAAYTPLGRG
ncbi:MAG: hypothetical protein QG608_800 [Actinomycetota bacterium]|nr:hypothetical protein [Actinomycetota bacterium]